VTQHAKFPKRVYSTAGTRPSWRAAMFIAAGTRSAPPLSAGDDTVHGAEAVSWWTNLRCCRARCTHARRGATAVLVICRIYFAACNGRAAPRRCGSSADDNMAT
jgi:hypothetical protein